MTATIRTETGEVARLHLKGFDRENAKLTVGTLRGIVEQMARLARNAPAIRTPMAFRIRANV
ncbi:hypothetical protein KGQ31_03380 [Patescibacteria group bacterium]|nr:hypothetical protein [Patescibacteria group bacterium]